MVETTEEKTIVSDPITAFAIALGLSGSPVSGPHVRHVSRDRAASSRLHAHLPKKRATAAGLLQRIAQCESDGGVRTHNPFNSRVIGTFQINYRIHGAAARRLGYNIWTSAGNWGYARYLLATQGTSPWLASASCWGSSSR